MKQSSNPGIRFVRGALFCAAITAAVGALVCHAEQMPCKTPGVVATVHGHPGQVSVCDGEDKTPFALMPEAFQVKLEDGSVIKASDFSIEQAPLRGQVSATSADPRASGEKICMRLVGSKAGLRADWCMLSPVGAHYVRQSLQLEALGNDVPIAEVQLLGLQNADAHVAGTVPGSPVVAGNLYFGFEHPLSTTTVTGDTVRAFIHRSLPLRAGAAVTYSSVVGIAAPGQMRRDFQRYLERERPRAYSQFLHYNSWFDLGYTNRFDEAGALDRIHAYGTELTEKRGVKLDSFLFDDGWDDPNTLWGFDSGFPHGFTKSSEAAKSFGAGIGAWLSPWGGYDEQKKERVAYGRAAGYEIVDDGYALSGPRYYKAFEARCLEMIDKYHVNQFKFDGTGNANHVFPGSLFDSDFEAAIALITRLRTEEPTLFVNLTTGTLPSPFWLRYADSIWRGGEDTDFAGIGSWRQKWITYRDAQVYKNIVTAGPLFPLNSLMLHGLVWAKSAEHLETDPGQDFANEVWSYFGTGTQLQEMYLTPSLLAQSDWDTLAKAAKWARANQEILRDSHWVGGDPGKLETYGWASWSAAKSILVVRNPSDKEASLVVQTASALELPAGASREFTVKQIYGTSATPATLHANAPEPLQLHPFEVRVLELTPVPRSARPE